MLNSEKKDQNTDAAGMAQNRLLAACGVPPEAAKPCPNCGSLKWVSQLNYSSTKRIDCSNGSIVSTLYGVCYECLVRHSS